MPRQGDGIKHKAGGVITVGQNRNQVLFARLDHGDGKRLEGKAEFIALWY